PGTPRGTATGPRAPAATRQPTTGSQPGVVAATDQAAGEGGPAGGRDPAADPGHEQVGRVVGDLGLVGGQRLEPRGLEHPPQDLAVGDGRQAALLQVPVPGQAGGDEDEVLEGVGLDGEAEQGAGHPAPPPAGGHLDRAHLQQPGQAGEAGPRDGARAAPRPHHPPPPPPPVATSTAPTSSSPGRLAKRVPGSGSSTATYPTTTPSDVWATTT